MRNLQIRNLIFIMALSLLGFACSDSATGPGSDSDSATINGRIEDNSPGKNKASDAQTADIEGVIVTAATVNADGSLETISDAEAETDAEGAFSLEVDAAAFADAAERVIVTAEQEGQTVKAFVSQQLSSGSEVTVQPLTFESTAEADVFAEVVVNGDTELVSQADIEAVVTDEMATALMSNANAASELAAALAAKADAEAEFYAEQGIEFTEDQKENALEIKAEALAELESELDAASGEEDKEAALAAFTETVAKARLEAGVQASAVAKSSELSSRILVNNSTELESEAKSEVQKNAAAMLAYTVDAAVKAQMETAEASESSVNAVADAAVDLRSEIKSMAGASKEEIDAAFATFNGAVIDILENEFSANAAAFVEVNSAINESNGAKSTLETALSASADLGAMIDAYSEFFSSVESAVDAAFTSVSDTEAEAFTEILILINIAS